MSVEKVRVQVPASTANLGPGFDSLGMALNLYIWIEMALADKTSIHLFGKGNEGIPTDKSNLIYQIAKQVFEKAGKPAPELEIKMHSQIPLARGLGSSASAIVGALAGANGLLDHHFSEQELFQMACQIENHPDNVAASIFGGIVVACWDGSSANCVRIQPHAHLQVLVAIPSFKLLTEAARNVIPLQISRQDAVFNLSHASMLVAALATGQLEHIQHAMKDKLHQPYRTSLIPGMHKILQQGIEHGALGVALSGAGPTMLALVNRQHVNRKHLEGFMRDAFVEQGIAVETLWLEPSNDGVQVDIALPQDNDFTTYIEGKVR